MSFAHEIVRATNAKSTSRGWWQTNCPYHDDKNPSLSFSEGGYNCHACGAKGHINELAEDLGLKEKKSFNGTAKHGAARVSESMAMDALANNRGLRPETIEEFGITFHESSQTYQYRDDEWPDNAIRKKSFNGSGMKYSWAGYQKGECDLYGLSQAMEIASENLLYLVEGEPDVWTAQQAGLPAVSFTAGATSVPEAGAKTLADTGYQIAVIYDLDTAGYEGAQKVAQRLMEYGTDVTVLKLPEDLPPTSDITDLYNGLDRNDPKFRDRVGSLDEVEVSHQEVVATTEPTDDKPWWKKMSDVDHSDRLIQLHGERLRYIPPWKSWLVFDQEQQRWSIDKASVLVTELAKDVGRYLKEQLSEVDTEQLGKVGNAIQKAMSRSGIEGMVKLARGISGVLLDHEKLDADPYLLGVRNGVVDLRTGELRPADPDDLMTLQCHVDYDPTAEAPRWLQALEQWFPDAEVRDYAQILMGLTLIGKQVEHLMAIHYGDGRNGKGTFVRALQYVLGDYSTVIDHTLLQKTQKSKHDAIKAKLFRKRSAWASETAKGISLDEASVKNLTGGDRLSAEWKFGNPWDFDPSHLIHLQTNYLPKIAGRDVGIWSRLKVVPWTVTFAKHQQDTGLDEALRAEGAGILRWLIDGCLSYQKHGLVEPEAVKNATLKYRATEDKLAKFIKDIGLSTEDPTQYIGKKELQEMLTDWALGEGIQPPTRDLTNYLKVELGVQDAKRTINGKRIWIWLGCHVAEQQEETDG